MQRSSFHFTWPRWVMNSTTTVGMLVNLFWCQAHSKGCRTFRQSWRSRPCSFLLLIWSTHDCKIYLIIPQWPRLRSGSQILDCNCRFCDDYACNCFLHRHVVSHRNSRGTASELTVCNCKYIPNMDCDGEPIWQLCWGTWLLLYSMLKHGAKKTPHFCAAFK